jgi:hypothetical protein
MSDHLAIFGPRKDAETSGLQEMESTMSDADYAAYVDKVNAEIQASNGVANRVCGDCTACCTVMGVVELNKANYQPCSHNCGRCGIYNSRPSTCRSWSCGWLLGLIEGDERRRPDQIGLLFNRETLGGKSILVAYEVWPAAGRQPRNEYLLRKMSQKNPIVLRQYETRKCDVITPDRLRRRQLRQSILTEWCQQPGAGWSECGYFTL